jgi:hypothetical protein
MSNTKSKQVSGQFEQDQNILHLWFPKPVLLRDAGSVTVFFDEVVEDWIDTTPGRFYLLVDYKNLHIAAHVADSYSANIQRFQHKLLATYRYRIPGDFTGVAVSLGNLKLQVPSNLFDDEASARAAIQRARGANRAGRTADSSARRAGPQTGKFVLPPDRK